MTNESNGLKGYKQSPDHIRKRIESKIRNGHHKHSQETKDKIRAGVLANGILPPNNKGKKYSDMARENMRGKRPWNKGLKLPPLTDETKKRISEKLKGRIFTDETKKKISEAKKGVVFTEEHKNNISIAKKGKKNNWATKENRQKLSEARKGMKFSIEHRKKISESRKGNKCHFWKGGRLSLNKQIRELFEYRLWRSDVFTRDDFICQHCGEKAGNLRAHHKKQFSEILDEYKIKNIDEAMNCNKLWDINNGITLCINCHRLYHKHLK